MSNTSLQLNKLNVGYHAASPILEGLELEFFGGNFVGLVGNNGIGKSTLLKTIAGLIPPIAGKVLMNARNLDEITLEEKSKQLSVVLTDKIDGFNLKVLDVVGTGRLPYSNYFGELSDNDSEVCLRYMDLCEITHIQHKSFSEISDGEKQKTLIARAFAQQTPVILLDEPTAFLDYSSKRKITLLLKQMAQIEKKIILLSSHDLEILLNHVDTVLYLESKAKFTYDKALNLTKTLLT